MGFLGFWPGFGADARKTQSDVYWRSANPIGIIDYIKQGEVLTEWVCACKADWTYIEEADEELCCTGRYADRMCVPEGYEPGYNFPVSPDLVPAPAGNSTGGSSVGMQESSFVDPGGSGAIGEGGG